MKKNLRRSRGFTLLEILAVVIIVGVLALVAVPAFLGARHQAEDSSCDANRKAILAAVTNYHARRGALNTVTSEVLTGSSTVGNQLVAGKFLTAVPTEPRNPKDLDEYTVTIAPINASTSTYQGDGYSVTVDCPVASPNNHGSDTAYL